MQKIPSQSASRPGQPVDSESVTYRLYLPHLSSQLPPRRPRRAFINLALDPNLDFEKTFSRFADFPASSDLFDVETQLVEEINEQLTQEVFNSSLGNW